MQSVPILTMPIDSAKERRTDVPKPLLIAILVLLVVCIAAFFIRQQRIKTAYRAARARVTKVASAPTPGFVNSPASTNAGSVLLADDNQHRSDRDGHVLYVASNGKDSNDGSRKHPFATIDKAASVVTPGTTVIVMPGTYWGEITTKASGTESARIRYESEQKWGAKLRTDKIEKTGVHWDNSGSYVDIVGFDMSGVHSYGIYNRGSHVRILNNHIHDYTQVSCKEGGAGVQHGVYNGKYSSTDNDTIGNVINNIRPPADCKAAHGAGIYHAIAGGRILNNVVYNNGKNGIQLWHAATDVIVANNTTFKNHWDGIMVGNEGMCCGSSTGRIDNTIVVNNISFDNERDGIHEYGEVGSHNMYSNNVVYNNREIDMHLINRTAATGTIKADPQFVHYDPAGSDGDYHLKASSPARGKCSKVALPAHDIEGKQRSDDGNCSIGAYE